MALTLQSRWLRADDLEWVQTLIDTHFQDLFGPTLDGFCIGPNGAGKTTVLRECFEMVTARSARLMRREDYGVEVGKSADLVVLDCHFRDSAVAEVVTPLYGFKRGRPTFTRRPAELHRP